MKEQVIVGGDYQVEMGEDSEGDLVHAESEFVY